jgi:hypothetical protein
MQREDAHSDGACITACYPGCTSLSAEQALGRLAVRVRGGMAEVLMGLSPLELPTCCLVAKACHVSRAVPGDFSGIALAQPLVLAEHYPRRGQSRRRLAWRPAHADGQWMWREKMARWTPNANTTERNSRSVGQPGSRNGTDGRGAGRTMPHRRVGVYERVGRLTGTSSAMTVSAAIVLLAIVLALIIAFVR